MTLVVGHLNLLSMIFAPLMLGLTIDYGIHWFCRLEEEQAGTEALHLWHPGLHLSTDRLRVLLYAGLAAALSFLPLIFMGFKGLAELGLILTMGILVMLVATMVLVPALVQGLRTSAVPAPRSRNARLRPSRSCTCIGPSPWLIVVLGLVIVAMGVIARFSSPSI